MNMKSGFNEGTTKENSDLATDLRWTSQTQAADVSFDLVQPEGA